MTVRKLYMSPDVQEGTSFNVEEERETVAWTHQRREAMYVIDSPISYLLFVRDSSAPVACHRVDFVDRIYRNMMDNCVLRC